MRIRCSVTIPISDVWILVDGFRNLATDSARIWRPRVHWIRNSLRTGPGQVLIDVLGLCMGVHPDISTGVAAPSDRLVGSQYGPNVDPLLMGHPVKLAASLASWRYYSSHVLSLLVECMHYTRSVNMHALLSRSCLFSLAGGRSGGDPGPSLGVLSRARRKPGHLWRGGVPLPLAGAKPCSL